MPVSNADNSGNHNPMDKPAASSARSRHQSLESRTVRPLLWVIKKIDLHNALVTAIATLAIAVYTYVLAHYAREQGEITGRQTSILYQQTSIMDQQKRIMERQIAEMRSEQRAWIFFDLVSGSGITYDKNGLNVTLVYRLQNVGHYPARNVQVISGLLVKGPNIDPLGYQRRICKRARREQSSRDGISIFPGANLPVQSTDYFTGQPPLDTTSSKPGKPIELIIVGCVDYLMPGDTTHHQTGFAYEIMRYRPEYPTKTFAISIDDGPLQPSEIAARDWDDGRAYYAD